VNLWQSQKWAALQKKRGFSPFFCEKILVVEKKLPFGFCFFEISRVDPPRKFWQKIGKIAAAKNAIFARFSAVSEKYFQKTFPEKLSPAKIFPDATRIIDLKKSEKEIFAQFSATGRRHARAAQKQNFEISIEKNAKKFAELSQKTAARDGFSAHSADYFRDFLEIFGDESFLLAVKNGEKWLAAGIFVIFEKTAIYYYGASARESRNAPTLLQFEAIKIAKKRGAENFDLLGISRDESDRSDRLFGVSRFKKKFGGQKIFFAPEKIIIFSKISFFLFSIAKFFRKYFRRK